jgi:succinate dehydrogenase subunit C
MSRRPYKPKLSKSGWWLKQPRYIRYMLREMSAAFIGIYVLLLITGLYTLSQGAGAYDTFLATVAGPVGLAFALITIAFAIYHTYTWFQVTPRAMPLMFGSKRVPGVFIVAAHWLGFVIASGALWLVVGY